MQKPATPQLNSGRASANISPERSALWFFQVFDAAPNRMRRHIYPLGLGLVIGCAFILLRALPFFYPVTIPKNIRAFTGALNAPALWLAHLWSAGGFPPAGKLAQELAVPSGLMLAQWILVALLLGLFLGMRKKPGSAKKF